MRLSNPSMLLITRPDLTVCTPLWEPVVLIASPPRVAETRKLSAVKPVGKTKYTVATARFVGSAPVVVKRIFVFATKLWAVSVKTPGVAMVTVNIRACTVGKVVEPKSLFATNRQL